MFYSDFTLILDWFGSLQHRYMPEMCSKFQNLFENLLRITKITLGVNYMTSAQTLESLEKMDHFYSP